MSNLSASVRRDIGYMQAGRDASDIFGGLKTDESIKIVTHSMGGAYGKGYAAGLMDYKAANGISNDIDFEMDFAPYQAEQQQAVPGVRTYQFSHDDDWLAPAKLIQGVERFDHRSAGGNALLLTPHKIESFKLDFEKWLKSYESHK